MNLPGSQPATVEKVPSIGHEWTACMPIRDARTGWNGSDRQKHNTTDSENPRFPGALGSMDVLAARVGVLVKNESGQLLAGVEHARLYGGRRNAGDLGYFLDGLAVIID